MAVRRSVYSLTLSPGSISALLRRVGTKVLKSHHQRWMVNFWNYGKSSIDEAWAHPLLFWGRTACTGRGSRGMKHQWLGLNVRFLGVIILGDGIAVAPLAVLLNITGISFRLVSVGYTSLNRLNKHHYPSKYLPPCGGVTLNHRREK